MPLKLRKLSSALGAEVCGVAVARPISETEFGEIYQAFLACGILLFREQNVTGIHLSGTRKIANTATGVPRAEEQRRLNPPVARAHPETGRKAL